MTIWNISCIIVYASENKTVLRPIIWKYNTEKYSRGRRGAPAKGVGRETGARVQIPLSPLFPNDYFFALKAKEKSFKKFLTVSSNYDIIKNASPRSKTKFEKKLQKK